MLNTLLFKDETKREKNIWVNAQPFVSIIESILVKSFRFNRDVDCLDFLFFVCTRIIYIAALSIGIAFRVCVCCCFFC